MNVDLLEQKILKLLSKKEYKDFSLKLVTLKGQVAKFLFEKSESIEDSELDRLVVDVEMIAFILEVEVGSIDFIQSAFNPIKIRLQTLNLLRQIAPAELSQIVSEIQKIREENVPEKAVKAALDAIRKQKLIHWSKSQKKYFLTKSGLDLLGSGIGSDSPDVIRLLALAKGKV